MNNIKCEHILRASETRFLPNAPMKRRRLDSRPLPNKDSIMYYPRPYYSLVFIWLPQSPRSESFFCVVRTVYSYGQARRTLVVSTYQ